MQVEQAAFVGQAQELNRRIAEHEAELPGVRQQYGAANRSVFFAGIRHAYRRFQVTIRRPASSFNLWPLGVLLTGPLVPGLLAFGLVQVLSGSFGVAFACFVLVAGLAAGMLACLLFVPNDASLQTLVQTSHQGLVDARVEADRLRIRLTGIDMALTTDKRARDSILKSVQYQRELLLQENWKAMRGPEWEQFLRRVFHLLGGVVQPTGKAGDQGVDLIVEIGDHRYAIQAKGYVSSVNNQAIQEAVAGMAHYGCNCSAVITNSGFTAGAVALAKSNCCLLIGEDQIPSLVLGQLQL